MLVRGGPREAVPSSGSPYYSSFSSGVLCALFSNLLPPALALSLSFFLLVDLSLVMGPRRALRVWSPMHGNCERDLWTYSEDGETLPRPLMLHLFLTSFIARVCITAICWHIFIGKSQQILHFDTFFCKQPHSSRFSLLNFRVNFHCNIFINSDK